MQSKYVLCIIIGIIVFAIVVISLYVLIFSHGKN